MSESVMAVKPEVDELSLLHEISQELEKSLDLHDVAGPVLELIAARRGLERCTVTLLNRETGEISIEAAHGLSRRQRERGRYRLGEGITGRVIATGQPEAVPRIAEEPLFLDRSRSRRGASLRETSFLCVPIKVGSEVVGALSADRPLADAAALAADLRLLAVIASMIAQALHLRQAAAEERQRLIEENARLQDELKERFRPANIIGNSRGMQAVYDAIAQVAKSNTTVLIRGESGVGKELVAHAIHHNSLRAGKPYIQVNCAALPETLLEGELFGHEKGAFTGALALRQGRFERASGGTLFLDEVGDFSPATQIKLLRVLQEKEFERLGAAAAIRADVRIIAATSRDLEELMARGEFRQDLYYRLNVFPIHIPPLRERRSDILLLADYFVAKYAQANHQDVRRISTPAIDMLMAYHWPGNVRELENCIERAVLVTTDKVIHGHHLPPTLQTAEESGTAASGSLPEMLDNYERELIVDALKNARGNRAKAARALQISERIMGLRVEKFGLDARRFRLPG